MSLAFSRHLIYAYEKNFDFKFYWSLNTYSEHWIQTHIKYILYSCERNYFAQQPERQYWIGGLITNVEVAVFSYNSEF